MKYFKTCTAIPVVIVFLCAFSSHVFAVPKLQLYIPGATYDTVTETWVYPGLEYDLWAIGSADEGETIKDGKLAAAVKSGQEGSINIQPVGEDDSLGWKFVEDSTPVKSDGNTLPPHGIYPSDFYEFNLGDFVASTPEIPDFTEEYEEGDTGTAWGEIKVYHVQVTGSYDWVHFDLYNHIEGDNHALFCPFSHDADAEDGGTPVPEPATMFLLGSGLIGLAGLGRMKIKKLKAESSKLKA